MAIYWQLCQDCNIWIDKPGCYQLQCLVVNDIDDVMITIHPASLCWSNSSILGTEMQRLQDNVWSQICDLTFINKHSINLCHSEGPLHHENPSADTTKRSHFWPRSSMTILWRDGMGPWPSVGTGRVWWWRQKMVGLVKVLVGVQCKSKVSY